MKKKKAFIFILLLFPIILASVFLYLKQSTKINDLIITNRSEKGFSVLVISEKEANYRLDTDCDSNIDEKSPKKTNLHYFDVERKDSKNECKITVLQDFLGFIRIPQKSIEISFFEPNFEVSEPNPIYGAVYDEKAENISDYIILTELINEDDSISMPISTYIIEPGGWSLDASNARMEDGKKALLNEKTIFKISFFKDEIKQIIYSNKENSRPVEDIRIVLRDYGGENISSSIIYFNLSNLYARDQLYAEGDCESRKNDGYKWENNQCIYNPSLAKKIANPKPSTEKIEPEKIEPEKTETEKTEVEIEKQPVVTCEERGFLCTPNDICRDNGTIVDQSCADQKVCCKLSEEEFLPNEVEIENPSSAKSKGFICNGDLLMDCQEGKEKCTFTKKCEYGCNNLPNNSARCYTCNEVYKNCIENENVLLGISSPEASLEMERQSYETWNRPVCAGTGEYATKVTQGQYGPFSHAVSAHSISNKCALDITGNPGTTLNKMLKENGYTGECRASFDGADKGYGCYVDLKYNTEEGEKFLRIGHLNYYDKSSCLSNACNENGIVLGASGFGTGSHGHFEVYEEEGGTLTRIEDRAECLTMHPCDFIEGGCYVQDDCSNPNIKQVAVEDNSVITPSKSQLKWFFVSKIYAEDNLEESILGEYVNENAIGEGQYTLTGSDGINYEVEYDGTIFFFIDYNGNGILDPEEEVLSKKELEKLSYSINKELEYAKFSYSKGWNLVAFPLIMQDEEGKAIKKASELLNNLNKQGIKANHISTYRNGFVIFTRRVDIDGNNVVYGEDFNIIPGEGYFVKAENAGVYKMKGSFSTSNIPIKANIGWNLVGIYTTNRNSASEFITKSKSKIDIISEWKNSRYNSYIVNSNSIYGMDFYLDPYKGYFIRNKSQSIQYLNEN